MEERQRSANAQPEAIATPVEARILQIESNEMLVALRKCGQKCTEHDGECTATLAL